MISLKSHSLPEDTNQETRFLLERCFPSESPYNWLPDTLHLYGLDLLGLTDWECCSAISTRGLPDCPGLYILLDQFGGYSWDDPDTLLYIGYSHQSLYHRFNFDEGKEIHHALANHLAGEYDKSPIERTESLVHEILIAYHPWDDSAAYNLSDVESLLIEVLAPKWNRKGSPLLVYKNFFDIIEELSRVFFPDIDEDFYGGVDDFFADYLGYAETTLFPFLIQKVIQEAHAVSCLFAEKSLHNARKNVAEAICNNLIFNAIVPGLSVFSERRQKNCRDLRKKEIRQVMEGLFVRELRKVCRLA